MPAGSWNVRMTLLISDANIFIDMEESGVIQQMFELPETFAVPDVLFIEELIEHHPELPQYGLCEVRGIGSSVAKGIRWAVSEDEPCYEVALRQQQ